MARLPKIKPAEIVASQHSAESCSKRIMAVHDALDVLSGRWKLPIMIALSSGAKRFKEISRQVGRITDKSLSKELKDLEVNQLISRTVYDSFPPMVEYSITKHGQTLEDVFRELALWGELHRKKILGK